MVHIVTTLACSQCGRELPPEDEGAGWKHVEDVRSGELDPTLLLCPECREESREVAYDEGDAG